MPAETRILKETRIATPIKAELLSMGIPRLILKVALPASLGFLMNMIFGLVDAYWVGQLGAEAMAGLSAAGIFTWILYSLGALGQVGVQALVSQSAGAGETELAQQTVMAGLILNTLLALTVLVPVYILRRKVFAALGVEPAVLAGCIEYIVPFSAGMLFYFPAMAASSAFYALGNTRTPALVLGVALALNAGLDPFLILGWGPFPRLGLMGAGIATGISQVIYTVLLLWLLRTRGFLTPGCIREFGRCRRLMVRIAGLGSPIAANGVIFSGVYLVLIRILSSFGTVPIATLGIAHRIEGLAWFTCVGFSVGAAALAGQLVGAGERRRALRGVWQVNLYMSGIMAVISTLYVFFGRAFVAVFISDPEVIAEGARYLLIIGLFEIFLGWEVLYEEVLGTVGASLTAFSISTPLSVLRVPLAWYVGVHMQMGVDAVWWIIALTTLAKGLALAAAYHLGPWSRKASLVKTVAA